MHITPKRKKKLSLAKSSRYVEYKTLDKKEKDSVPSSNYKQGNGYNKLYLLIILLIVSCVSYECYSVGQIAGDQLWWKKPLDKDVIAIESSINLNNLQENSHNISLEYLYVIRNSIRNKYINRLQQFKEAADKYLSIDLYTRDEDSIKIRFSECLQNEINKLKRFDYINEAKPNNH